MGQVDAVLDLVAAEGEVAVLDAVGEVDGPGSPGRVRVYVLHQVGGDVRPRDPGGRPRPRCPGAAYAAPQAATIELGDGCRGLRSSTLNHSPRPKSWGTGVQKPSSHSVVGGTFIVWLRSDNRP